MNKYPKGFLSKKEIDHDSPQFRYIQELHDYLWEFIRLSDPGAGGKIEDCVDNAIILAVCQRDFREKLYELMDSQR